jgi:hypothetical protein
MRKVSGGSIGGKPVASEGLISGNGLLVQCVVRVQVGRATHWGAIVFDDNQRSFAAASPACHKARGDRIFGVATREENQSLTAIISLDIKYTKTP